MKDMNHNKPKAGTSKGGGGTTMKQSNPNGDNKMPSGKVDQYVGWKVDGGSKNGRVKGC